MFCFYLYSLLRKLMCWAVLSACGMTKVGAERRNKCKSVGKLLTVEKCSFHIEKINCTLLINIRAAQKMAYPNLVTFGIGFLCSRKTNLS